MGHPMRLELTLLGLLIKLANHCTTRASWDIKNVVKITTKHLQINQISALDNPQGTDIPLNKLT